MSYHITLTTRDDQQLSFDCAADQSLIDAADAAQINLPSQCRQGSCGACHASVETGNYLLGEHNPAALPADRCNAILMCRTIPRGDLRISLPYDHAKIQFRTVPQRSAEIVAIEPIARNTVRLELCLIADEYLGSAAEFEPGQFMELEVPGSEERRAFSLANTSNWDGRLEFLIRLQADGLFSTFVRQRARPGMKLMTRGPLGAFGIVRDNMRPHWFVGGGTGLAPLLSMLRHMAEYQETQETRLFFGVNCEDELFARNELQTVMDQLPQLRVTICVWQPQAGWTGYTGTPADALRRALMEGTNKPSLYVCGPPALIDAVEQVATDMDIAKTQVFSERFLPA